MKLFITLLAIVLGLIYFWLKYMSTYWKRRGIPHNEPEFLTGNIKEWRKTKHLLDLLEEIYKKYKGTGPFAGFYFFFKPVVVVTNVDVVKQVLIKDFNNFDDRGVFHNARDDPLTEHLFAMDGPSWRTMRQKLSQTFTSGKMKFMYSTVSDIGYNFLDVVKKKTAESKTGELEMVDLCARFTADVIGSCAFGLDCRSLYDPQADFVVMGKRVLVEKHHNKLIDNFIESFPAYARWLRMRQMTIPCAEFYMRIAKETVDYREKNNVQRNDFINMLIELKNKSMLTFNELAAQCFVFFIAGFETSSTTMGFALYELAKRKDIQDKLRDEINRVMEQHKNELTYECLQDMRYLERVVMETLRKYPVVPHLVRVANKRFETSDPKYYIEKGTSVFIPVYSIHHDPEIYEDPENFDPDRFTEENIQKRPACSWLPFGDGPRNCIGLRFGKMQAAIGLAQLIKNFKFSICDKTPKKVVFDLRSVLLSSVGGMYLHVEKV